MKFMLFYQNLIHILIIIIKTEKYDILETNFTLNSNSKF